MTPEETTLEDRIREAEEIIRAQNRLVQAMYNSDLEESWPKDASRLQQEYEQRYEVELEDRGRD